MQGALLDFFHFLAFIQARAHLQICPSPQHTPPPSPPPLPHSPHAHAHARENRTGASFCRYGGVCRTPAPPSPPSPSFMMQGALLDFFHFLAFIQGPVPIYKFALHPSTPPPSPPPLPHSPHAHAHARENRTGASFCRYGGVCRTPAPPSPPSPSCMMQGALLDFFHFLAFIQGPVPIYKFALHPSTPPPSPPPLPHSPHAHAHARENRTGASFCRYGGVCRTPAPPSPPSPSCMMQGALLDFFHFLAFIQGPVPIYKFAFHPSTPPPLPTPSPPQPSRARTRARKPYRCDVL